MAIYSLPGCADVLSGFRRKLLGTYAVRNSITALSSIKAVTSLTITATVSFSSIILHAVC